MKTAIILLASLLAVPPLTLPAAQTAQARIYCLSLRFQRGSADSGSTLDLSTLAPSTAPNGELAPTFDSPTHVSGFILDFFGFPEPASGDIGFDVPADADANQNGFPDFFETSQAVSGTTAGAYQIAGVDEGQVRATWSRGAGSKDGTCVLGLTSSTFGPLGDFRHSFELIEFVGPLDYTPGTNRISGAVNLTQTGGPSSRLAGPIEFTKSPTNRFNKFSLQHGTWTNALAQRLNFSNDLDSFFRDLQLKTNYFGFVDFEDGDLSTPEVDYSTWQLSIDDANDSNGNGIPDFSDDPVLIATRPPTLGLSLGGTMLEFRIGGQVGRLHEVQQTASLIQTNWETVLSITLANDPQVVTLPLPTNPFNFWRVRVP
jgi:hypothetical protein